MGPLRLGPVKVPPETGTIRRPPAADPKFCGVCTSSDKSSRNSGCNWSSFGGNASFSFALAGKTVVVRAKTIAVMVKSLAKDRQADLCIVISSRLGKERPDSLLLQTKADTRAETDQKQTRSSSPGQPKRMTNVLRKVTAIAILTINDKEVLVDSVGPLRRRNGAMLRRRSSRVTASTAASQTQNNPTR